MEHHPCGLFHVTTQLISRDVYKRQSLLRPGRFDYVIYLQPPIGENAENIVSYYLMDKDLAEDVDKRQIVCCNYIIYRLVMKTLQKMGKTVPEDYSLVCFDYSEDTYRQEDVTLSLIHI